MSGDYISREALQNRVDEIIKTNHLRPDYVWFTPNGVKTLAKEAPTADVVERKSARWKGAGLGDYYCSLCNETYSIGAERVKSWHYCPNCGAKMDGGQDDA